MEARDLANDIISNGPFQLVDRVDRGFNLASNSSEDIFAIQVTQQDGINNLHNFYASRNYSGRRDIRIRTELLEQFDQDGGDRRELLIYYDGGGRYLTGKYTDQFANISVIRLPEII